MTGIDSFSSPSRHGRNIEYSNKYKDVARVFDRYIVLHLPEDG